MFIRPISDLHLEFQFVSKGKHYSELVLQVLDTDKDTVLVIAGDMDCKSKRQVEFLIQMSQRFLAVIYVLGNHDLWGNRLDNHYDLIRQELEKRDVANVHVLQNTQVLINNVAFIGATLWTDFQRENEMVIFRAQNEMNDYEKIRVGSSYRKIRPVEILKEFKNSKKKIFEMSEQYRDTETPVVVVTHHAPSWQSMDHPDVIPDALTGCYVSDLDNDIHKSNIKYWIHGHCHHTSDYTINDTRVICNPRGYSFSDPKYLNSEFNPEFTLSI